MTKELGTAHRQEKERTTKIIKNTLVSVPRDDEAKQRSGELRHEGQGGRSGTEHEGLRLSEFDPVEGGACIHGDQRRRDRKVISPLHQSCDLLLQRT